MSNIIEFSHLCPGCFAEKGSASSCPHCGYDESLKRGPLVLAHRTLLHNGQYLIGKVLGKPGGFGITYLVLDTRLETRVAIKEYLPRDLAGRDTGQATISAHSSEDGEFFRYGLTQFLQEARTLARFDHANIVRVRNFFEENGTGYLVMDYYDGVTLADHLSQQPQGKLPEKTAVGIMMPILDGLREVHAKNFLHRDIKPQNIYLTTGNRPILLDFGAARQAMSERSRSLSVVLSEGYAPYEQYHRRGEQGPWTDIYACAAVLYHAVSGEPPPPATERMSRDELDIGALRVSTALTNALRAGLAVDHKKRPQTMAEFQGLLMGDEAPPILNSVVVQRRKETRQVPPKDSGLKMLLAKWSLGALLGGLAVLGGQRFLTGDRSLPPEPLTVATVPHNANQTVAAPSKSAIAPDAPPNTEVPVPVVADTGIVPTPPLKIAFAYVGPVGDGGWTFAHDNGRKAIEKKFGDKVVTSFVERVPESADAERVFRDMAAQGNKLIFGTTFGYMEPMLKVAADHKDVKFEHATGYKTAENMRTYDSRTYEGAYMAGVIAGKMTKTNTLGVVGSIPIPEVIRNINSFTLGAQLVNPEVKTKVVWVNEWFSPPKETEAATALINGGADVLMQNTDSSAVLQTAEKMGKRAFGWDSDMTAYGPKAHLGSAVTNWGPYYIKVVGDALNGKWTSGQAWWGVKQGAVDLVSVARDVPEDGRKKLNEVKAGLKDGSFVIWKGPIMGQDGKEVLAKDAVADDKFLGGINFYVKGVEGKIPGGK